MIVALLRQPQPPQAWLARNFRVNDRWLNTSIEVFRIVIFETNRIEAAQRSAC
jgi:hypothetical protein